MSSMSAPDAGQSASTSASASTSTRRTSQAVPPTDSYTYRSSYTRGRRRGPTPWFHNRHSASSRSSSPLGSSHHDSVFLSWLRRIDPAFLDSDLPGSWPLELDDDPSSSASLDSSFSSSSPTTSSVKLDCLPEDILLSLLDHLPRDAYLNLALTCTLFFRLAHDPTAVTLALRRWFGCTPTNRQSQSLHTHLKGTYTGFAIDRCTNQFDPYPMHLTLPPCPLSCTAAYRHLLASTASHGEGHCHWPSLGNATTRLTSIAHAPWSDADRGAIAAKFMRDRHADALTWTELDLLSPPPPPLPSAQHPAPPPAPPLHAAHVNQIALPNAYQAIALGPWLLGTFDPAQSQLSRGAFVLLATDAQAAPSPAAPPTCAAVHALAHGSRISLHGLLANTHAPMSLPNVTLTLTYHDPPLPALPFRTVLRRPPVLPGPVRWTGSIAVTPGVGAAAGAAGAAGDAGAGACGAEGIMSSSGILLTGQGDKEAWVHGIALDVAGCVTTSADGGEEWHLYASLDHWQAQHDRAEARRKRLGTAKGPGGAGSGGHVSEWSRTYAPLLDRISVRVVTQPQRKGIGKRERTRVVGWWKYPTLSCFFAEVDLVEHVEQVADDSVKVVMSKGKGKAKIVVDGVGLSALGL